MCLWDISRYLLNQNNGFYTTLMSSSKDEDLTSKVLGEDGWMKTGDLGKLTANGHLIYLGRKSDTIRLADDRIAFPLNLETALHSLPIIRYPYHRQATAKNSIAQNKLNLRWDIFWGSLLNDLTHQVCSCCGQQKGFPDSIIGCGRGNGETDSQASEHFSKETFVFFRDSAPNQGDCLQCQPVRRHRHQVGKQ